MFGDRKTFFASPRKSYDNLMAFNLMWGKVERFVALMMERASVYVATITGLSICKPRSFTEERREKHTGTNNGETELWSQPIPEKSERKNEKDIFVSKHSSATASKGKSGSGPKGVVDECHYPSLRCLRQQDQPLIGRP